MMAEDIAAGHDMSLEAARFHLELTGDLDQARKFADEEYRRRPANQEVNLVMAELWLARGDRRQASAHLEKAMSTNSQDPALAELRKKI
jgi:thioredoxin-like negative regulator of GroEL